MSKVAPVPPPRKARFNAALELAQTTARQWASDHGVSYGHLHAVLNGRESLRLNEQIDAFIHQHLPERVA